MPVGRWVMRTAVAFFWTFWPPWPLERKTSMRRSSGLIVDVGGAFRLRHHLHEGERRVTGVVGVERREADQAVDAALAAQPPEGVAAVDLQRRALDAGFVAGHDVEEVGLVAAALRPAQVHAQEHLRPVLRLGAAGAGVDGDDGVCDGHRGRRRRARTPACRGASLRARVSASTSAAIASSSLRQVRQLAQVTGGALHLAPGRYRLLRLRQPPHRRLRRRRVVPEAGPRRFLFELRDLLSQRRLRQRRTMTWLMRLSRSLSLSFVSCIRSQLLVAARMSCASTHLLY